MPVRPSTFSKRKQRRVEKARKGGLATLAKYGPEHYSAIGKLGGRPTWEEALAKAKAHEAEVRSRGVKPGRSRLAPPSGETKEMPAEAAAYRETIITADKNPETGAGWTPSDQQVSYAG